MDEENEALARRLSDVWFEMYHACVLYRPELAAEMDALISPDLKVSPPTETVRSYMAAIVRGALVTRPVLRPKFLRNPIHWLFR